MRRAKGNPRAAFCAKGRISNEHSIDPSISSYGISTESFKTFRFLVDKGEKA